MKLGSRYLSNITRRAKSALIETRLPVDGPRLVHYRQDASPQTLGVRTYRIPSLQKLGQEELHNCTYLL